MSKSPLRILTVGYLIGKLALADYAHKFSPKTYTEPQLFACLVLKEFLHRDYRGIEELLRDTPELAAVIELKKIPDFTTLQKASQRLLLSANSSRLLDMTVRLGRYVGKLKSPLPKAALDESRINTSHSERFNLSIRMGMRRFTRLTNGFSKSHIHHEAALALFFMHYNFCQRHGTLKTTPAVAAKLTDRQWTIAEMIERTANYLKPEPQPPTWGEFLGTIPDSE